MSGQDTSVPRFNVHSATFEPIPEYGDGWHQKLLYESPDGARKAGSFKEVGHFQEVMPYDEFIYVVAGSTRVSIEGGETFQLTVGDCCYLRKGLSVTFDHAPDFHDVAVLVSYGDDN